MCASKCGRKMIVSYFNIMGQLVDATEAKKMQDTIKAALTLICVKNEKGR